MFIALEGADAAGKNTHSEALAALFRKAGRKVVKFEFPQYNSITGEMIKGHLKGDWRVEVALEARVRLHPHIPTYMSDPSTYMFQCCQLVNRMETLPDELWDRALDVEDTVFIADRYNASAYAYGLAFGLDLDWLLLTHRRMPQPDINILLDISVEESFSRRPERRDAYERNAPMLETVRKCYLDIFSRLGPTYHVIDAMGPKEQTFKRILDVIREHSTLTNV